MFEKFTYEFDEQTKILFKYYKGSISIREIELSWDYAIENNLIPKNLKGFVLDYRSAFFDFDITENHRIAAYYKQHLDVFRGFKIAIITESARDVVVPLLVKDLDDGYYSRPFSTREAAIEWVLL